MSDQNGTTEVGSTHFTAGEVKFLLAALQHADGGTFKFDYDAVAAQLRLKDGKTARARWNTIARTKINSAAPAGGVDKAPSAKKAAAKPKKNGTSKKRGAKAKKEESSEEGGVKVEEKGGDEDVA